MKKLLAILLLCAGVTAYGQGQPCVADSCCLEGTVWSPDQGGCVLDENYCSWQPDSDGDQLIGVSDLLMFLSVFGDTDLDQDGIFDSNDDCVGEYDECGVCNGSGPSIPVIESIEILYDSVYAEQIDEWWVFEVGADTTYSFWCNLEGCTDSEALNFNSLALMDDGSCEFAWVCGDDITYQGDIYPTIEIGASCWFGANCKYLPSVSPPSVGSEDDGGAHGYVKGYHGTNVATARMEGGFEENGALYNFQAIENWSLCPSGWHVANADEFNELSGQFGGNSVSGPALKSEMWDGTNASGFNAMPNGRRSEHGFGLYNRYLVWTSVSVDSDTQGLYRFLETGEDIFAEFPDPKHYGQSARCIKDTE